MSAATPSPSSHREIAQLERLRRAVAPSRGVMIKRVAVLSLLAICVYVLGPSVLATLDAWPQVQQISWLWLIAMGAAQIAANASLIWLQALAMRSSSWFAITTAELSGGAVSRALPGGSAAAAGIQYSMLVRAGVPAAAVASGLTAASLLTLATVFVLPVVSIPVLIAGGTVPNGLADAAWLGLAIFAAMVAIGWWVLGSDRPLVTAGRAVERIVARVRPKRPLEPGLPQRLIAERDDLVRALGSKALYAIVASLGRWMFDYLTLLAALTAVGANPNPVLVLLAYAISQMLASVPITPGGLGIVEAGLVATLALAGISGADALVATFAYRLFSYWLPMPVGLGSWILFRHRYPPNGNETGDTVVVDA
jgi:uncharacterized protein (TIRG00374 family)